MTMVLEQHTEPAAATPNIVFATLQIAARGDLARSLNQGLGVADLREASDFASLSAALATAAPVDIVLLDLAMPSVGGLAGLLYLRSQHPRLPVVVFQDAEDPGAARRCIEAGAAGVIPAGADANEIGDIVQMVLDGEIWIPTDFSAGVPSDTAATGALRRLMSLTPQQLRVLMMVSQGLLNKQIAYELTVSEATVKAHVSAILQKLGVDNRIQAVAALSYIGGSRLGKCSSAG